MLRNSSCRLLIPESELALDSFEKISLWQQLAETLLKKRCERYCSFRNKEWKSAISLFQQEDMGTHIGALLAKSLRLAYPPEIGQGFQAKNIVLTKRAEARSLSRPIANLVAQARLPNGSTAIISGFGSYRLLQQLL